MNLVQRKARPITRDTGRLRDDRLFIVACDDTFAPKQYFEFFRITRVQVHVVPTIDGTSAAAHVLGRLLQFDHEEDYELWMLLDTDHCMAGSHSSGFMSAIKEARQKGVKVALSKPCFELWLLLHHVEESAVVPLANAGEVEKTLRATLGQYNKTHLRHKHYPLATVFDACKRAERLETMVEGVENPNGNRTQVYLLWKAITSKALPSQLPLELRDLLP